MSDKDPKKPAPRDISDLKARLGLKKGGAAPGSPGAKGSAVPPPPGLAPPQPAQPQIPDARVDPFGAMNAMAAQGAAQAQVVAQPIVITAEDTKMLKAVRTKTRLGYLKWAGVGVGALVLGWIMGGISYKNAEYNRTIDDAKRLTKIVKDLQPGLQAVNDALLEAKGRDQQERLLPNDAQLTERFKELVDARKLVKPDPLVLFHSYIYYLDPKLVEDTFSFYSDLAGLYDRIERHVRLSASDANKTRGLSPELQKIGVKGPFAAYIAMPQQEGQGPPTAEIVELGAPVCSDNQPHPEGCGAQPPVGFQYRPDPTQPAWGTKAWSPKQVDSGALVLLGGGRITEALVVGAKQFVDEYLYMQRISEIDAMTTNLSAARKQIEDRINQKAQESKRFSL